MDSIDRKLVSLLQHNGKLAMKELSRELGLSITPIYDRLRRLEQQGIITGYHAHIDEKKMGFGLEVFCSVTLESHKADFLKQFEGDIKKFDEVLECYHLAGSFDFLLKVLVRNMDDYGDFVNKKLAKLENIGLVHSHMVLNKIKQTRVLPVD
ncbi:Lrp/AsnC family transcriptional regulator [Fulvivirga lutimaris]|uniref:Lrp/AsnC family transcriptional regulator n=1 Tax=Fulvivirga lutimaris TaxID=1819566 RepID=UPI0012BCE05C|nr:Lrp/AsnC family transcriptional regulator [Fulvivirga lutimaris]MTI41762.1 Lrp/AsnC family transcriptional regulator [Fulvivirga lutimaris]